MNESEKLRIVEKALWDGVSPKSDNEVVIENDWVQYTNPFAPVAFMNGVARCEVGEDRIQEKISSTLAHFKKKNLPFRWKLCPSSRPQNLASLLTQNGLPLTETLYGLYADPKKLHIPINPDVKIEELTLQNLEEWLKVQASAWGVPPQGIARIREVQTHELKSGQSNIRNFLAYYKNLPVASAALSFRSDYAFLMGAAVNPDQRGKGIYCSLLSHRLKIIADKSLPAVIHCLEKTSAPICLKLGFEKICEIQSFEYNPFK